MAVCMLRPAATDSAPRPPASICARSRSCWPALRSRPVRAVKTPRCRQQQVGASASAARLTFNAEFRHMVLREMNLALTRDEVKSLIGVLVEETKISS
eukprot:349928-Chlamydomonas_euryale.AAC.5